MAARRRTRKSAPRRRRSSGVNVVNAAQSLIVMNATTRALFGVGALQFATQGWLTEKTTGAQGGAGNSWTISASELLGGLTGMGFGQSGAAPWTNDMAGLKAAMERNLKQYGPQAIATVVLAPAAFKVAKKLTSKPRADANRLLKMAGLNTVVKV